MKTKVDKKIIQNPLGMNSHRYITKKGEISLIYPSYASMDLYEIYCIKGDLFDDIERFDSLEEAEKRIHILLN